MPNADVDSFWVLMLLNGLVKATLMEVTNDPEQSSEQKSIL